MSKQALIIVAAVFALYLAGCGERLVYEDSASFANDACLYHGGVRNFQRGVNYSGFYVPEFTYATCKDGFAIQGENAAIGAQ